MKIREILSEGLKRDNAEDILHAFIKFGATDK